MSEFICTSLSQVVVACVRTRASRSVEIRLKRGKFDGFTLALEKGVQKEFKRGTDG